MNLKDIIDLAKAGYKPSDVKELIELAEKHTEQTQSDTDNTEQTQSDTDNTEQTQSDTDNTEQTQSDTDKELETLKSQVKKLQDENTKKDVSGNEKNDADILADFIRGFM